MLEEHLLIDRDLYAIKYKILRRVIRQYHLKMDHLYNLTFKLEGKTLEELEVIHKEEIGC